MASGRSGRDPFKEPANRQRVKEQPVDPETGKLICGRPTTAPDKHPCKNAPGYRTGHVGYGGCFKHGGCSPNAEKKWAIERAKRDAAVMGTPLPVHPANALVWAISIAAGEVQLATEMISKLSPDEIVGPVVSSRPLKLERGAEHPTERVEEHGPDDLNLWIRVRHLALDRLVHYSKVALHAGVAERQVKIAEQQAELMITAVRGILGDLGVANHPEAPMIVRRHLQLMSRSVTIEQDERLDKSA